MPICPYCKKYVSVHNHYLVRYMDFAYDIYKTERYHYQCFLKNFIFRPEGSVTFGRCLVCNKGLGRMNTNNIMKVRKCVDGMYFTKYYLHVKCFEKYWMPSYEKKKKDKQRTISDILHNFLEANEHPVFTRDFTSEYSPVHLNPIRDSPRHLYRFSDGSEL